jgi:NADPH:quinone reductase-like Zn-dependent oxidoreductase
MQAIQLTVDGGPDALTLRELDVPVPGAGEVLVRVCAAAITRDELSWPTDRLPAIPSYELSGVVAGVGPAVSGVAAGDEVYGLTPFDRDGVAAEYAVVPASALAARPSRLDHVATAAIPMGGLTAWQGLFEHGRLEPGERVLIHGSAGGVGHLATQLAHDRGAYVIGVSSGAGVERTLALGADEALDRATARFEDVLSDVDLVFDTVGGDALARSGSVLSEGGRIVSVAEEHQGVTYFVVEPSREQLAQLARLADAGRLQPAVDSTFPLAEARAAFLRLQEPGKGGKVVLLVGAG